MCASRMDSTAGLVSVRNCPGFVFDEKGKVLDKREKGYFFCCSDDEHNASVNEQPVGEEEILSVLVQLLAGGKESYFFDIRNLGTFLALLSKEQNGNIIFVRIGEAGVTAEEIKALQNMCGEALKKKRVFCVVTFANLEGDSICCFVAFGKVAFACLFAKRGKEFASPFLIQLKGLDMSVFDFLYKLVGELDVEIVSSPMHCVHSGKVGGSDQLLRLISLFFLLAGIQVDHDVNVVLEKGYCVLMEQLHLRLSWSRLPILRARASEKIEESPFKVNKDRCITSLKVHC